MVFVLGCVMGKRIKTTIDFSVGSMIAKTDLRYPWRKVAF